MEPIKSRLTSIDFLRGAASLSVLIFHAMIHRPDPPLQDWMIPFHKVILHGFLGVPLFFVISGFCIHLRWAKQYAKSGEKRKLDFTNFWKRRLHRLYPPYFIILCITMGMVLVAYFLHRDVPILTLYPQPRLPWIGIDFVAHVFMLHGLHPVLDEAGGNGVYWTLAREEYFYIMYFGLLAWRRWRGVKSSVFTVMILGLVFPLLMSFVLSPDSRWWAIVKTSAIVLWIQWCLGMLAVEAYYGLVKLPRWCYWWALIPVWGAIALYSEDYFPLLTPVLWGMTFFTLLNCCVRLEQANRWPNYRFVRWMSNVGVFSYSLYLVHNAARMVVKQMLGPIAATTNSWLFILNFLLMAVAGYYAGKLYFILVERRFLNTKPAKDAPSLPPGKNVRWIRNIGTALFARRRRTTT